MKSSDIEKLFSIPVVCDVYDGMILPIPPPKNFIIAEATDSWQSIALTYGCEEEALKKLNGGVLFPTKRIYLP